MVGGTAEVVVSSAQVSTGCAAFVLPGLLGVPLDGFHEGVEK